MRGRMDKIITEYMIRFSPEAQKQPPPGELTFDLLEAFADEAHTPVKLKVQEDPVEPLQAKEGTIEDINGGYCLPEITTVWQKYLARKDDALEPEASRLQKEMLLVISKEFLAGVGVDTYSSFTSLKAAGRYYIQQLAALPGSEAAELKSALESITTH